MEEYHFAFGIDANYVKYAGVMMTSIVWNHPGQSICFHLACDGLHKEDKARLETFSKLYSHTRIELYDVREQLQSIKLFAGTVPERLNRTVFLRILLPELLPETARRLVYLDADMLCVGDLAPLWNANLEERAVGALLNPGNLRLSRGLGLSHTRYLSAGTLVIDVAKWREQKLTQRVLKAYRKHGARFSLLEEDALNLVLDGDFTELPAEWIAFSEAFNPLLLRRQPGNLLLHFINDGKPWIRYCAPEMEELYWGYVRRSLWSDMQPLEPWEVKIAFLAGLNAKDSGHFEDAAHYLSLAGERLMQYYLEHTGQIKPGKD